MATTREGIDTDRLVANPRAINELNQVHDQGISRESGQGRRSDGSGAKFSVSTGTEKTRLSKRVVSRGWWKK